VSLKIRIDTREQKPLEFSHPYITEIERLTCPVGDYMATYADGYTPPIAFERKSISDLFGTLTHGHDRFKREIARAKEFDIKLILIIEGSLSKVLKGVDESQVNGLTIVRQLMTMWIKHGLTPVFCKDREEMSTFITEYFCSIGRLKGHKPKEEANSDALVR